MLQQLLLLSAGLLTFVTPASAQLPYNPARIILAQNSSVAYVFSPQPSSSQSSLNLINTSDTVSSTPHQSQLFNSLPFLSDTEPTPFIALPDEQGINVLAGDCNATSSKDLKLWRFTFDEDFKNGTWSTLSLSTTDRSLKPQFLSAGFTFSATGSIQDATRFIFGGMCPNEVPSNTTAWISSATYSNTMLTVTPDGVSGGSSGYQLSWTGARAPPIPEAGLTITPLTPTSSNTSDSNAPVQQNFVLLGGHTQNAFINMSQVAIFSLPEESWAFVGISQAPTSGSSGSSTLEPRSGHSAILTEDGSKIIVLGGWVGDVSNPAEPQLMVLQVGQGYGGQGQWTWNVPASKQSPFPPGVGVYGHGVAMLPGGIMMVSGGYSIRQSGPRNKRQLTEDVLFLNTTSFEWIGTYENPNDPTSPYASGTSEASRAGLSPSERAGLGAGLGLGLAAAIGVAIVWLFYSRRLRTRRAIREKELRELALGAERIHATPMPGDDDLTRSGMRTPSWGAMQEQKIESFSEWPSGKPVQNGRVGLGVEGMENNQSRYAERTGVQMEIPSPTRGLRKGINTRGPGGYGPFNQHPPNGPGAVFRIDEEDEGSQSGSLKWAKTGQPTGDRTSVMSDPFKDPPNTADGSLPDPAAARRKREVEGWVEDWQSAAESMSLSRSTSQAHSRTYSNLSQFRSPGMVVEASGRGSPEKSDRTGSNLSENSMISHSSRPKSIATSLTRNTSQRSTSAGYSLFSSAVAAMGRFGNARPGPAEPEVNPGLSRTISNRSASLNIDNRRPTSSYRDRTETFSSARSGWAPSIPGDDHTLLNRNQQRQPGEDRTYRSPAESPSKEKYAQAGSLTGSSRKAINLLGSVKRVFTGTGSVDVPDRVAAFESQSGHSSPTKHSSMPEMTEAVPRRTLSAGASFWRSKQGAKDWESDLHSRSNGDSSTIRRKPVPGLALNDNKGALEDEDDWDVESAVQRRVVQVMFTVPKEKLRVVNADALSLLSSTRSEGDFEEDRDKDPVKRMSSVREGNEDH